MGLLIMQICLSFYEVKNKHATWFTNKVERLYWEHWYINLNVMQHPKTPSGKSHHSKPVVDPGGIGRDVLNYGSINYYWLLVCTYLTPSFSLNAFNPAVEARGARRAALEASLRDVLFQIIKFVNEKKDHVPSIPNVEGIPFPYEITISRYFCSSTTWMM